MSAVTLNNLSAEDRQKLLEELKQQEEEKERRIAEDRKAYKLLVNETIPPLFTILQAVSVELSAAKHTVFDSLQTLIKMKADVYGKEEDQSTHSFTTDAGITLIIGRRVGDGWDDTVTAGLDKVNKFLASLATDEKSKMLVKAISKLLAKDAKGNLKSSRVLQLKKIAEESGNAEFIDGVRIISDAYRPVKSREFVTALYKNNEGASVQLALDITAAEMPEKEVEHG